MNKQMRAAIKAGKELLKQNIKTKCTACNGTGRYDTTNSPKCSACNGTGITNEQTSNYSNSL